jgi:hypothetical protein
VTFYIHLVFLALAYSPIPEPIGFFANVDIAALLSEHLYTLILFLDKRSSWEQKTDNRFYFHSVVPDVLRVLSLVSLRTGAGVAQSVY